ncbi:MAG: EamA family transporter, partial [Planctomycetota bacterium]
MPETSGKTKSNALLLLAAAIWGFAFVAQKAGMEHVGPFTFNGIRFALGAAVLLPFLFAGRRGGRTRQNAPAQRAAFPLWLGGLLAGSILFFGASLQQMGIVHTTAGKAGFITGLYVVVVPI